jgi:ABC-type glutathione transport system ATPase component
MVALLTATDLVKSYRTDGAEQVVLRGVSMTVEAGEWVGRDSELWPSEPVPP